MDKKQKYSAPTVVISDKLCSQVGLTAQWCGIDRIGIHAYSPVNAMSLDEVSEWAPCHPSVHLLRPDSVLFDPIIRKLVNESSGTFLACQKLAPSPNVRPETLKISRQYRSIVRACIENLQQIATKLNKDHYERCVSIFYNIEFVWHLCEILYVDPMPGDVVLPQLLDWLRFHLPDAERAALAILDGPLEPGAETRHDDYWATLTGLVMLGHTDYARALLRLHSLADTEPFLAANTHLRHMPVYTVYGGLSVSEFNIRWKAWQANVNNDVLAALFSSQKHLNEIMKIISRSGGVDLKRHCESWYQLMVVTLLYSEPTVKSFDLSFHANQCIASFGGPLRVLDHIVRSLLESNLHEVIEKLQVTADSGWCAAHLTNLLYHCGRLSALDLDRTLTGGSTRMDEALVLEYGTLLMSHQSLWQIGVTYLDHCPSQGRARLELLLPRLKLTSERRVLKVMQVATERDMHAVANYVCRVVGMASLRRKRPGNALSWALRSQDAGFASHLADAFLQSYAREGVLQSLDLLDNMGTCMLVSDRLTFLGKYCEFHRLYRNKEMREAADLLAKLIDSKSSPKYFWLTLLSDALPLLEWDGPPLFPYKATCDLMACLEELVTEEGEGKPARGGAEKGGKGCDKTSLIRAALTRNLAKSIIYQDLPGPVR